MLVLEVFSMKNKIKEVSLTYNRGDWTVYIWRDNGPLYANTYFPDLDQIRTLVQILQRKHVKPLIIAGWNRVSIIYRFYYV